MGGQEVLSSFHREEDKPRNLEGPHRGQVGDPGASLVPELGRAMCRWAKQG